MDLYLWRWIYFCHLKSPCSLHRWRSVSRNQAGGLMWFMFRGKHINISVAAQPKLAHAITQHVILTSH